MTKPIRSYHTYACVDACTYCTDRPYVSPNNPSTINHDSSYTHRNMQQPVSLKCNAQRAAKGSARPSEPTRAMRESRWPPNVKVYKLRLTQSVIRVRIVCGWWQHRPLAAWQHVAGGGREGRRTGAPALPSFIPARGACPAVSLRAHRDLDVA